MDDWHEVHELFEVALELAPAERRALLASRCRGAPDRRAEVEELLAAVGAADLWIEWTRAAIESLAAEALTTGPEPGPGWGEPSAGDRVGPYRIVRTLGRGGMASVHLAERVDRAGEGKAALKVLASGMDAARFLAERRILETLSHPHIARLLDGGATDEGRPYLVLEYVDGEPITRYCESRGLSTDERLGLFGEVCEAVEHAHGHRVLHRDLKPGNILVTAGGGVKLLDFGIATSLSGSTHGVRTRTGVRLMTPRYASPEQLRGEPLTAASDVYQLGLLLFELLAGTPYRPEDDLRTGEPAAVAGGPDPTRPRRLRGDLGAVVLRALAAEREGRYPSVRALLDDVERSLSGRPVAARWAARRHRARELLGRPRFALGATAALLLVAAAQWSGRTPPPAPLLEEASATAAARELALQAGEFRRAAPPTLERNERIARLYRRALELDPTFAEGWAGLASTHMGRAWAGPEPQASADSAIAAARRALELDSTMALAHTRIGDALGVMGASIEDRIEAYGRALELDPGSHEAVNNLLALLQVEGRLAEKMRWLEGSRAMGSEAHRPWAGFAHVHSLFGNDEAADAWLAYAREHGPSPAASEFHIALYHRTDIVRARRLVEELVGEADEILETRRRAALALYEADWREARRLYRTLYPRGFVGAQDPIHAGLLADGVGLAFSLQRLGQDAEAREIAEAVARDARAELEAGRDGHRPHVRLAAASMVLGVPDAALEALGEALERGFREVRTVKTVPVLGALRGDPRFQALVWRMEELVAQERRRVEREGWGRPPAAPDLPIPHSTTPPPRR